MPAEGKPKRDLLQWIGAAAGLLFLGLLGYGQRDRFLAGQNDFVQLYAGARLSGTPGLYDPAANRAIQQRTLKIWLPSVYYSRPPFYALALRPLGNLPYRAAYWIFESFSLLALAAFFTIWAPRCRELLLYASLCLPLLSNVIAGQDLAFVLLAASGAILAMRRNRDVVAGGLLSLCAIKPHLVVLVPVVLLINRRWAVLKAGVAAALVLAGVSFLSDGIDWPKRYAALLASDELHPGAEHMPTLRGLLVGCPESVKPWIAAVLALAVVAAVIFIAYRSTLEFGLAIALVGGLLIGYHAYLQDCSLLLLVFVLILQHSRSVPLRAATALVLTPPLFLLLLAGRPWSAAVPVALLLLLGLAALHPETLAPAT